MFRKLVSGSAVVGGFRLVAAVVAFLATPVLLLHLGAVDFGVYAIGTSAFVYLSVLDFGFTDKATIRVAAAAVKRFSQEYRVGTAIGLAQYLGVSVMCSSGLLLGCGPVCAALNIPKERASVACVFIALLILAWGVQKSATIIAIPLDLTGRFTVSQGLPVLSVAMQPALAVAVVLGGGSLVGVGAGTLVLSLASWALQGCIALSQGVQVLFRDLREEERKTRLVASRSFGLHVQLNSMADLVNYSTDRLIVSAFFGVGAVSVYEVANRPALFIRLVALAPVTSLFAAVVAVGFNSGEGKEMIRRTAQLTTIITSLSCAVLVVDASDILELWLGPGPTDRVLLMQLLCVAYSLHSVTGVFTAALRATGRYGLGAAYSVLCAVLNVAITLLLVPSLELLGVVLGTTLGLGVPSLMLMAVVRRRLELDFSPFLLILKVVICSGAAGFLSLEVSDFLPDGSLLSQISLKSVCVVIVFAVSGWLLDVSPMRPLARQIAGGARRLVRLEFGLRR